MFSEHISPTRVSGDLRQGLAAEAEAAFGILVVDEVGRVFQQTDKIPVQFLQLLRSFTTIGDIAGYSQYTNQIPMLVIHWGLDGFK